MTFFFSGPGSSTHVEYGNISQTKAQKNRIKDRSEETTKPVSYNFFIFEKKKTHFKVEFIFVLNTHFPGIFTPLFLICLIILHCFIQ